MVSGQYGLLCKDRDLEVRTDFMNSLLKKNAANHHIGSQDRELGQTDSFFVHLHEIWQMK